MLLDFSVRTRAKLNKMVYNLFLFLFQTGNCYPSFQGKSTGSEELVGFVWKI